MRLVLQAGSRSAIALWALGIIAALPASAQISDQSVNWYIKFVWNNLGTQFSERDGTVIRIDKSKMDDVVVPLETARGIIIAGWRGARTRVCDMPEYFVANFDVTKVQTNKKGEWTVQQRHFMKELYQRVVQLNSGKTKIVVSEDGKVVSEEEVDSKAIKDCTDEERASLKKEIEALVKKVSDGPPPAATASNAEDTAKRAAQAKAAGKEEEKQ